MLPGSKHSERQFHPEFPQLHSQAIWTVFDLMVFSEVLIYLCVVLLFFTLNTSISKGNFILLPQLENEYHFARKREVTECKDTAKF